MNKSQMIKVVAEKSELSQKQVAETWSLIEAAIIESLKAGEHSPARSQRRRTC